MLIYWYMSLISFHSNERELHLKMKFSKLHVGYGFFDTCRPKVKDQAFFYRAWPAWGLICKTEFFLHVRGHGGQGPLKKLTFDQIYQAQNAMLKIENLSAGLLWFKDLIILIKHIHNNGKQWNYFGNICMVR